MFIENSSNQTKHLCKEFKYANLQFNGQMCYQKLNMTCGFSQTIDRLYM